MHFERQGASSRRRASAVETTQELQHRAAEAARDQALASYRQTVLAALVQVADLLRALDHDAAELAAEADAVRFASEALDLIRLSNQSGLASYLQVLTVDEQFLQTNLGYVQSRGTADSGYRCPLRRSRRGWWNGRDGGLREAYPSHVGFRPPADHPRS